MARRHTTIDRDDRAAAWGWGTLAVLVIAGVLIWGLATNWWGAADDDVDFVGVGDPVVTDQTDDWNQTDNGFNQTAPAQQQPVQRAR
jgi:hypothetical protein